MNKKDFNRLPVFVCVHVCVYLCICLWEHACGGKRATLDIVSQKLFTFVQIYFNFSVCICLCVGAWSVLGHLGACGDCCARGGRWDSFS